MMSYCGSSVSWPARWAVGTVGRDRRAAAVPHRDGVDCSLALLRDDSELVYTTTAGEDAEDVTGMRISSSQGIAGWVVQSGQPIAISDLSSDPRFSREVAKQTGYVRRPSSPCRCRPRSGSSG